MVVRRRLAMRHDCWIQLINNLAGTKISCAPNDSGNVTKTRNESMQKVCLGIIESLHFDYANAFERAFKQLNVDAEIVRIPFFLFKQPQLSD